MDRIGTRTCSEPHQREGAALGLFILNFLNNPFLKECERQTEVDGPGPGFTLKSRSGILEFGIIHLERQ